MPSSFHNNALAEVIATSPRLAPRTKIVYLRAVNTFVAFAGASPEAWTPLLAQQFYNQLLAERAPDGTPQRTPQTANGIMYALRYAGTRLAALYADPARNFAAAVELRQDAPSERPVALRRQDVVDLLATCAGRTGRDIRDRALIGLAVRTGMRRSSLCRIDFGDFTRDRTRATLNILIKGGRWHAVPLSESIQDVLAPWRAWLKRRGVESGRFFRSFNATMVADESGEAVRADLTENGLYAAFAARARQVRPGLHLNPHVFRHTFVTWCQEMGVPTYAITAITGHQVEERASIVDRTYTDHAVAGTRAIEAIDRYLVEGPPT